MKYKRGKVVGFKVGVYGNAIGNTRKKPATNACVFATKSEATRAGHELLSRWMGPEGFRVIETTKEKINYRFPRKATRPEPLTEIAPREPHCAVIKEEHYAAATSNHEGWCPSCQEFTRDCTEPDAEGYDCPACGGQQVVGAEQALLLGLVTF